MESFDKMSIVDWVYSNTWTEYPFLRQQQLKKLKQGFNHLVQTIPDYQCGELAWLTISQPALEYPDVNTLQCFKDLKQEIADIDSYLRGE
jgi:hypothetical protein